jgi:hypothetical protein
MGEVILFRPRGAPFESSGVSGFSVMVEPHYGIWLVTSRKHSWLHVSRRDALRDANNLAAGHGVSVVVYGGARS